MKRRELHLPVTCALIGVLWAICWGMIHRQSELDRTTVHLEQSVPLAVAGLVFGVVVGWGLQVAVAMRSALAGVLEAVLVPVLVGSIVAPFGWFARDAAMDWSGEPAILRAGAWGAGAGLVLYVGFRLYLALRNRKVTAELGVPADRTGTKGFPDAKSPGQSEA